MSKSVENKKYKNNKIIKIGDFDKLPCGEARTQMLINLMMYLDSKSFIYFLKTSIFKNINNDKINAFINKMIYQVKGLYLLLKRYQSEFPHGTPIVCACEHGRMDNVESFVNLHSFHKYITNRDVNGYRDDMTLKDMVSQVGKASHGYEYTPLLTAVENEHFQVVKYLIEQCEADPNIANSSGQNALHIAADRNRTNTELIELLLTHMTLNSINKKNMWGSTPLDNAYYLNHSPIRQEIIALILLKGGKANYFDENGRKVEKVIYL